MSIQGDFIEDIKHCVEVMQEAEKGTTEDRAKAIASINGLLLKQVISLSGIMDDFLVVVRNLQALEVKLYENHTPTEKGGD